MTPWTAACQASLSISRSLLKLMSIELVMPSNRLVLFSSCPQFFPASKSFLMSRLFASGGQSTGASASASVLPMNIPMNKGLISFRIDWFDLLSAQGTLKSLHQHHSSKASILQHSAFFMVQFSHPYMTTDFTANFGRAGSTLHLILAHTISKLKK